MIFFIFWSYTSKWLKAPNIACKRITNFGIAIFFCRVWCDSSTAERPQRSHTCSSRVSCTQGFLQTLRSRELSVGRLFLPNSGPWLVDSYPPELPDVLQLFVIYHLLYQHLFLLYGDPTFGWGGLHFLPFNEHLVCGVRLLDIACSLRPLKQIITNKLAR